MSDEVEIPTFSGDTEQAEIPQFSSAPGKPQGKKLVTPVADAFQAGAEDLMKKMDQSENLEAVDEYLKPSAADDKTTMGFAKNTVKSIARVPVDIGKGMLRAPAAGVRSAAELSREISKPGKYELTAEGVGKELGKSADQLGDSLLSRYSDKYVGRTTDDAAKQEGAGEWVPDPEHPGRFTKKQPSWMKAIWDAAYEDPVGVLLDAMVVKDLATAAGKGLGKKISGVGDVQAAKTAESAMAGMKPGPKAIEAGLQATETPNRAQAIGGKIEDFSSKIDTLGGDLIKGGVNRIRKALGDDPVASEKTIRYLTEERSRASVNAARDYKDLMPEYVGLPQDVRNALGEVATFGEAASPEALAIFNSDKKYADVLSKLQNYERENWLKAEKLIPQDVLDRRIAAQVALKKYGSMDEASLKAAAVDVENMGIKPIFVPTERERRAGITIDEMLDAPQVTLSAKPHFLQRFRGIKPFIEDPMEFVPRIINDFRKVEGDVNALRRIQNDPTLVRAGTKADINAGNRPISTQGIAKRYWEHGEKYKAKGLFTARLEDEFGPGWENQLATNKKLQKEFKKIASIIPERTTGRILRMEFNRLGGVGRWLLDKWDLVNSVFRKGAIDFNPAYISGNAAGDAILSLIADVMPSDIRRGERLLKSMPPQAIKPKTLLEETTGGWWGKAKNWYNNEVDAASRRGLIAKGLADKLKTANLSRMELEDEMRRILESIEKLGQAQVERHRGHEQVAQLLDEAIRGKRDFGAFKRGARKLSDLNYDIGNLQTNADIVRPLLDKANRFFGNYDAMHPVEQYVFRRINPFYAFNKAMFMLGLQLPMVAPKASALFLHFADYMEQQEGVDNRSAYSKDLTRTGFKDAKGREVFASGGRLSPFNSAGFDTIYNVPIPSFANPRTNPIVNTIMTGLGAPSKFSAPYMNEDIPAGSGKVRQQNPNGTMSDAQPAQPSIAAAAGSMFPALPRVERLVTQTGGGLFAPVNKQEENRLYQLAGLLGIKLSGKTGDDLELERGKEIRGIIFEMRGRLKRLRRDANNEDLNPRYRKVAADTADLVEAELHRFVETGKKVDR